MKKMQLRKPRSEINKDCLAELSAKISHARETGEYGDAKLAKGMLLGLEHAGLFRGAPGATAVRKLNSEIDALIEQSLTL